VVAIFNWNSPKPSPKPAPPGGIALEEPTAQAATTKNQTGPITVKLDLKQLGLPASQYAAFDYWENTFLDNLSDGMEFRLPPGSCKVLSVVPRTDRPQLLSNSRHVAQENLDLTYVRWQNGETLAVERCGVAGGEPCELRIATAGREFASVELSADDRQAGVTAQGKQEVDHLRVVLTSPATRQVSCEIRFAPK